MNNGLPRGVICFTNPQQMVFIRQHGLYGNVSVGDRPTSQHPLAVMAARRNRFGKLKDLLCIVPGDSVYLFETGT
jgi:hypothetical protein